MNKKLFWPLTRSIGILLLSYQAVFAVGLPEEKRLSFTIAAAPWNMTLPAKSFEVVERKVKRDGSGAYFYLTDEQSHLNVSFYIEPVSQCTSSKKCRDMIWKGGNPAWENPQNVVSAELGDISYVEFLEPSVGGLPIKQQNMYAEFVVNGFWVDLHISKVLYKAEDHNLFADLVNSIKFEPKKTKTS
ncbi:MAG TPA: hypothetical protein VLL54_21330 [Pyrinomonadaceae bacterium]|nr:hypothetical protein [Pyrinomonadaceae bacterium]